MVEGVGFEPTGTFTNRLVSSEVPSATRPSFRYGLNFSNSTSSIQKHFCFSQVVHGSIFRLVSKLMLPMTPPFLHDPLYIDPSDQMYKELRPAVHFHPLKFVCPL